MKRNIQAILGQLLFALLVTGILAGCKSGGSRFHQNHGVDPVANTSAPPVAPLLPSPSASAPALGPAVEGAAPRSTIKYGGQKTCPVMGDALGSMGEPIPVTIKGEMIYVCCRGCVRRVQADPDKYLAIVKAEQAVR